MWWACHGVPPARRSASAGPASSISTSTTAKAADAASVMFATICTIQPSWAIEIATT